MLWQGGGQTHEHGMFTPQVPAQTPRHPGDAAHPPGDPTSLPPPVMRLEGVDSGAGPPPADSCMCAWLVVSCSDCSASVKAV